MLGRCRIEKLLGRGGMGAVFLAQHTTLDIPVAVKIMLPNISRSEPEFAERFMREAKLASRIRHANVIQVMDAECDPHSGVYYIVQEFIDGGTIRTLMQREGLLPETKALDIIIGVAEALVAAAEFNIVHRDIKPENIMLNHKGEVKLADLGIAKECGGGDDNLTVSQMMMGTPAYLAPEQARDAKTVDARADIYSLGATFYHMLCGEPPHTGDTTYSVIAKLINEPAPDPRKKRPDLSKTTATLVMRMIDKDREHRPKNAKALLDELLAARKTLAALAVPAAAPAMPKTPPAPGRRPAIPEIGKGLARAGRALWQGAGWLGRGAAAAAQSGWRPVAGIRRQTWRRLGMGIAGTALAILLVVGARHFWLEPNRGKATAATPPVALTPPASAPDLVTPTAKGPAAPVEPTAAAKPPPPSSADSLGLLDLFKGTAGAPDLTNQACYLRINLFWEKEPTRKGERLPQITTLNLHQGMMLPAGTAIIVNQVSGKEILFTAKASGIRYSIQPSAYMKRESMLTLPHRYFAEQDPLQTHAYRQFTQVEKEAIKNGQIVSGMSKEAVIMAYGYPPGHGTKDLAEKTWAYWIKGKRDEINIDFENDRVAAPKAR
jgi:hypothetical protein